MKLFILVLLVLALMCTPAFGDVLLTWDSYPADIGVDLFQVEIDGVVVADVAPNVYSLVTIQEGDHIARVRAHNAWGWSIFSADFSFKSGVPGIPTGVHLEVTP